MTTISESQVADRIEQAPACEVINLTADERVLYRGAGWKLARFEQAQLVELFTPMELPMDSDWRAATVDWIDNAEGEIWLAMCSCGQLCEPRRIGNVAAVATVITIFEDEYEEFFNGAF